MQEFITLMINNKLIDFNISIIIKPGLYEKWMVVLGQKHNQGLVQPEVMPPQLYHILVTVCLQSVEIIRT